MAKNSQGGGGKCCGGSSVGGGDRGGPGGEVSRARSLDRDAAEDAEEDAAGT